MRSIFILFAGFLVTLTPAKPLKKPPLEPNLDYLQKGLLEYLHSVNSSYKQWDFGWIPKDCKEMTESANLSAADVEIFSVQYDDCPNDPWILCRHKDSLDPLENMIDLFGRVPVRARQWVRHILYVPDPNNNTSAYNSNGNIAMFGRVDGDLTVFVHETGHSLDLLGAYADNPLSSSQHWLQQYKEDSHVPDPYSQTNQLENVAQNTVVATYNLNVRDGFMSVEPKWADIFEQYFKIEMEQNKAGKLLVRGGVCGKRLENSLVVGVSGNSSVRARGLGKRPDVGLSFGVDVIAPVEFDTRVDCECGS